MAFHFETQYKPEIVMAHSSHQDNEPSVALHPSSHPPADTDMEEGGTTRVRLERLVRDAMKKVLEKGVDAGIGGLSIRAVRGVIEDAKLPREIANYFFSQIEETKSGVLRVAAREIRHFLRDADLASELRRVLTSLSFEIRTEIRFIPNETGDGVRPQVRTGVGPKAKNKERGEEST
jgi:hypothetical protein